MHCVYALTYEYRKTIGYVWYPLVKYLPEALQFCISVLLNLSSKQYAIYANTSDSLLLLANTFVQFCQVFAPSCQCVHTKHYDAKERFQWRRLEPETRLDPHRGTRTWRFDVNWRRFCLKRNSIDIIRHFCADKWLFTHAGCVAAGVGREFSRVCQFICLSVCPRSKRKTAWAIDTKLGRQILYPRKRRHSRWKLSQELKWKIISFVPDYTHTKMAGRKRERYKIQPRISVPFMLELQNH